MGDSECVKDGSGNGWGTRTGYGDDGRTCQHVRLCKGEGDNVRDLCLAYMYIPRYLSITLHQMGHVFCGNQYKYKYTGLNIEIVRERAPGKEQSVWETEVSVCGGRGNYIETYGN